MAETATAATIAGSEASRGPVLDVADQDRAAAAQQRCPMPPPHEAQHHGLDQELPQDVVAAGADGHAQADLPRPLGDRDEHDVHDAHAADDQRDQRPRPAAACSSAAVVDAMVLVISVMSRMLKSSVSPGADAVPLAQQVGDLVDGLRDLVRSEAALTRIWSTLVKRTGCGVSAA